MKRIGLISFFCLALALYFFSMAKPQNKNIMALLGSNRWDELTDASLSLSESMGLTDHAPAKFGDVFDEETIAIDINYANEDLFLDGHGAGRELPYLGHILELQTLIPLDYFPNTKEKGMLRVFEVDGGKRFICVFSDGSHKTIVGYSPAGKVIDILETDFQAISQHENHLLLLVDGALYLYEITARNISLVSSFATETISKFLQEKSLKSLDSDALHFSDIQFEWRDGQLTVWGFNCSTTAFMPDFLHLKFNYSNAKKPPHVLATFGRPTQADRLPVSHSRFRVLRVGDGFWTPRLHDAQFDLFDRDGRLLKTARLGPIAGEIGTGGPLTSKRVKDLALQHPDPDSFIDEYSRLNPIIAIDRVAPFILATRLNRFNPRYPWVYTLVNANGDILAEDFCLPDIVPLGSGSRQCLSLTRFSGGPENLPQWLLDSDKLDFEKIKNHPSWWLLGFEAKTRVGYNARTIDPAVKTKSGPGNRAQNREISSGLKKRLLQARQLRNLLKFDGFIKLRTPDRFGMRQVSKAIMMDGSYIVLDERGKQVLQFDETGQFIRAISRQGEGPGEYQNPHGLNRAYADHFVIGDRASLLLFNADGGFVRKIEHDKAPGLTLGGNRVIWEEETRLYLSDPFLPRPGEKQHAAITIGADGRFVIGSFGERFHNFEKKFALSWGQFDYPIFEKIGARIWVGSPYKATLAMYDLDGALLGEINKSRYPNGISHDDFEKLSPRTKIARFKKEVYFRKTLNHALHALGPIVIRTMLKPEAGHNTLVYDVYNHDGDILAKALNGGPSILEILDSSGDSLIGKIPALERTILEEENLKRFLYKPEWEALIHTGLLEQGDNEDSYFLWSAHLMR